ncbi:MAG TPA: 5-(carboxyamino)imidazole ribonucleotide mutase [bacterium]|mgnify:CR=1 FL=1|nr:5-(carboxyamino)imidazole ribonucleotide mutase [bacterium]
MAKMKEEPQADIAVIMGSDSDLNEMNPCFSTLDSFGINYTATIASAHRTHDYLKRTVSTFERAGGKILIAAAGGAAHLPGVIAALTPLPVIGVPMASKLLGVDSLLSIVQMPAGMPVATVSVGGSKNAALLAVQILSLNDPKLRSRYSKFRAQQADAVIQKSKRLKLKGYKNYFEKD